MPDNIEPTPASGAADGGAARGRSNGSAAVATADPPSLAQQTDAEPSPETATDGTPETEPQGAAVPVVERSEPAEPAPSAAPDPQEFWKSLTPEQRRAILEQDDEHKAALHREAERIRRQNEHKAQQDLNLRVQQGRLFAELAAVANKAADEGRQLQPQDVAHVGRDAWQFLVGQAVENVMATIKQVIPDSLPKGAKLPADFAKEYDRLLVEKGADEALAYALAAVRGDADLSARDARIKELEAEIAALKANRAANQRLENGARNLAGTRTGGSGGAAGLEAEYQEWLRMGLAERMARGADYDKRMYEYALQRQSAS